MNKKRNKVKTTLPNRKKQQQKIRAERRRRRIQAQKNEEKQKLLELLEYQQSEARRRIIDRALRKRYKEKIFIEQVKKELLEKYGTEPTICYYYYLWNAVDYVGEDMLRESFKSLEGQGNEVIVGDYGSTDGTKEIAEEYGFKVVEVEKTKNILFHESKIANKVIFESKSNFLVDLNAHTIYPKMDEFFKSWINERKVKLYQLAARGLWQNSDGKVLRRYSASCLIYKPYLIEARGYDERTYYSCGITPYALSLLLDVYKLIWDNRPLDMVHKFHKHIKFPNLEKNYKVINGNDSHSRSLLFGETLIDKLLDDFYKGVKKVKNSYW